MAYRCGWPLLRGKAVSQSKQAVCAWSQILPAGWPVRSMTKAISKAGRLQSALDCPHGDLNRSMAGSVVGVQPFGGEGLSGTGPQEATMSDTGAPGASRAPNGVAWSWFGRGRRGMLNPRPFRSPPIVASLGNTQPVAPVHPIRGTDMAKRDAGWARPGLPAKASRPAAPKRCPTCGLPTSWRYR